MQDHLKDGFNVGSRKGVLLPVGGDMKFAQPEDRNHPNHASRAQREANGNARG
ncbi:hypothetical protein [Providencia hangzhouensis]|uniref:hypothetical protein n=1 Tax=Providencia hangzhouensis TaxID=3031799 RepID=UPI0034DCF299